MANRILLKGDGRYEEDTSVGTLKPGYLVERTSTPTIKAHATQGGYAERAVVMEDALQGDTISDSYTAGDLVPYKLMEPGAECLMWLYAGENVSIGDKLISNGDGTLIKNGSEGSGVTVKQIIAIAQEALDLSDSGDVTTQLAVRIL